MPQMTIYAVVKLTVDVVDETSADDIAERIGSEADYKVEHEDDVCTITDTELIHTTPEKVWLPV